MAQARIEQTTVETLGKFPHSKIYVHNLVAEALGNRPAAKAATADHIVVEVLGKFTFQVGLVSTEYMHVELLGETDIAAAAVESIRVEVIGEWSGF